MQSRDEEYTVDSGPEELTSESDVKENQGVA